MVDQLPIRAMVQPNALSSKSHQRQIGGLVQVRGQPGIVNRVKNDPSGLSRRAMPPETVRSELERDRVRRPQGQQICSDPVTVWGGRYYAVSPNRCHQLHCRPDVVGPGQRQVYRNYDDRPSTSLLRNGSRLRQCPVQVPRRALFEHANVLQFRQSQHGRIGADHEGRRQSLNFSQAPQRAQEEVAAQLFSLGRVEPGGQTALGIDERFDRDNGPDVQSWSPQSRTVCARSILSSSERIHVRAGRAAMPSASTDGASAASASSSTRPDSRSGP